MKRIREVVLYLTDLTPGQILESSTVMVPKTLAPRADEMCQLNGTLLEYFGQYPSIKNRWVQKMNDSEWRTFWATQYPGQEVRVYQAQTTNIQYTLGVVMWE